VLKEIAPELSEKTLVISVGGVGTDELHRAAMAGAKVASDSRHAQYAVDSELRHERESVAAHTPQRKHLEIAQKPCFERCRTHRGWSTKKNMDAVTRPFRQRPGVCVHHSRIARGRPA